MSEAGRGVSEPRAVRWELDNSPRVPDPRMIPRPELQADQPNAGSGPAGANASADPADADNFVRPFYLTGGRTLPLHDGLRLHTLVMAPPAALHAPLRFELRRIVELCQKPLSVAEIAAGLDVPVGVTRVLIADLIAGGHVSCHDQDEDALSVEQIERIAQRVRAL